MTDEISERRAAVVAAQREELDRMRRLAAAAEGLLAAWDRIPPGLRGLVEQVPDLHPLVASVGSLRVLHAEAEAGWTASRDALRALVEVQ